MLSGGCRGGVMPEGFWEDDITSNFCFRALWEDYFSLHPLTQHVRRTFRRLGIPPSHCGSWSQNFFRKAISILCEDLAVHVR